jgi:hypothetical protein
MIKTVRERTIQTHRFCNIEITEFFPFLQKFFSNTRLVGLANHVCLFRAQFVLPVSLAKTASPCLTKRPFSRKECVSHLFPVLPALLGLEILSGLEEAETTLNCRQRFDFLLWHTFAC